MSDESFKAFAAALRRALVTLPAHMKTELNNATREFEKSVSVDRSSAIENRLAAELVREIDLATDLKVLDKQ